jgi:type II secretory pathway pseudopilin PulG
MPRHNTYHRGFTLVEMVIIAPIMLIMITVFIGLLVTITGEVLIARTSNSMAYDTQAGLNMIEEDIRLSGSFLAENNITISTPQGPTDTTGKFANIKNATPAGTALILNAIATSGGANQSTREPVWLKDSPNSCTSADKTQNQVMTYNIVYYIKSDNTLWRRVVIPAGYATKGCTTPRQVPTCTLGRTEAICKSEDTLVLSNVSGFSINYFTSAGETSALPSASSATATAAVRQMELASATTVKIDLATTKPVAGQDITYSSTLRATRIGSLIDYATP